MNPARVKRRYALRSASPAVAEAAREYIPSRPTISLATTNTAFSRIPADMWFLTSLLNSSTSGETLWTSNSKRAEKR